MSPEAHVADYAEVMLVTWHTPSGYGMTPIMYESPMRECFG